MAREVREKEERKGIEGVREIGRGKLGEGNREMEREWERGRGTR